MLHAKLKPQTRAKLNERSNASCDTKKHKSVRVNERLKTFMRGLETDLFEPLRALKQVIFLHSPSVFFVLLFYHQELCTWRENIFEENKVGLYVQLCFLKVCMLSYLHKH